MQRTSTCGPFAGELLAMYPALDAQWEGWLGLHPETLVVSSDTGYDHDYYAYPYGDYEVSHNGLTYFPQETIDPRFAPKERVLGIPFPGGGGMAFPFRILQGRGGRAVFQFMARSQPTMVFWDVELVAAVAYDPVVNGQLLNFFRINRFVDGRVFDEETGSEWSFEGVAFDGPLKGTKLRPFVEAHVSFWFAWATFVPGSFLMATPSDEDDGLNAGKNDPPGLNPDPGTALSASLGTPVPR